MNTCTNCGATLRPGAKFCTTCGTRLNEMPKANTDGWGAPGTNARDDSQETTVMRTVQPQESPAPKIRDSDQARADSWAGAYGGAPSSSNDPASRFISALDNDVHPAEDQRKGSIDPESTWDTPAPVFTPPPPSNWSYSGGDGEQTSDTAGKNESAESGWGTPSTWAIADEADKDDDDAITGDESVDSAASETDTLPPDEARDKAIALADELRRTIRMMSSGGESDHGAAVMALTEASLHVGDFSDVRGVLANVKNDPRDIEALGSLAGTVDRLETLLNEHKALADAVETAIKELNGF